MTRLLSAFLLVALTACGSSDAPKAEESTAAHGHDHGHSHDAAPADKTPAAEATSNARVFFTSPADGATVTSPVKLAFGIDGMAVEAAGQINADKGHHHVIINGTGIEAGKQVPKDETHIHYGGGQTEAEVILEPGEYTLTMQFADGAHMSYGEGLSTSIKITVEK